MGFLQPTIAFVQLAITMLVHRMVWGSQPLHDEFSDSHAVAMPYEKPGGNLEVYVSPPLRQFSWATYTRSTVSLFLASFDALLRTALEYFHCVRVGDGLYVAQYPAVSCTSAEYEKLRGLFVLALLFLVSVPVLLLVNLLRETKDGRSKQRVRARWGILYEPYRHKLFWWGLFTLIQRSALVSIDVFVTAFYA